MQVQIARVRIPAPDIIESLCWPRHAIGVVFGGRPTPDDWIDDLREHGVKLSEVVSFALEDILERVRLTIHADGMFSCDPEMSTTVVEHHRRELGTDAIKIVTDEGDSADSLSELIGGLSSEPEWLYPLDLHCRISIMSDADYTLALADGQAKFLEAAA